MNESLIQIVPAINAEKIPWKIGGAYILLCWWGTP